MTLLVLFFSISIFFSFLCSIWEAVLLSIPQARVELLYNEGNWVGKKLKIFKENIDKPLAGILSLNTVAHTVGSIGVGSQAARLWSENYIDFFGVNISAEAIVASLMTLGILILSEIIPKTIGANYWRQLTSFTIYGVNFVMIALYPFVWFSQIITKLLKNKDAEGSISRSEFYVMAKIGADEGALNKEEYKLLESLNRFQSIKNKDIMTPRTVIISASEDTTLKVFFDNNQDLQFSRIPIYKDNIDSITGYVLKDDVYANIINGKSDLLLRDISRNIFVVQETSNISNLLRQFIDKNEHIALLVDEYGGASGITTMEDVLETLLGMEIMDESDKVEDMRAYAQAKWKERAKRLGIIKDD